MLALSLDGIDRTRLRAILEEPKEESSTVNWFGPSLVGNGDNAELLRKQHRRMLGDDPGFASPRLHVSVALSDGSWLNMRVLLPPRPPFWSGRALVSLAVTLVLVVLVVVWTVRRMTRPLAVVAAAADRLGRDVNAPPLPVRGANEMRRAASAFNRMQERIRSLVETRTRMLAAISHDLRTPITRLRLRAEFIEDDEVRAKTMADLAEMEDMVSSVLAFSREDAQAEERETVDLSALLQSVCDNLADTGSDCEFAEAASMPFKCRRLSLRRAITNLANNAIAYGKRARLSLLEEEGNIVIRVDDDGPGVPEEELARIFEPFVRLEDSRNRQTGGTGLGLCIVQSVAEAHGGNVRLSNRPEGGLRAELVLPR
jgi:signal transduction histidine kinase